MKDDECRSRLLAWCDVQTRITGGRIGHQVYYDRMACPPGSKVILPRYGVVHRQSLGQSGYLELVPFLLRLPHDDGQSIQEAVPTQHPSADRPLAWLCGRGSKFA